MVDVKQRQRPQLRGPVSGTSDRPAGFGSKLRDVGRNAVNYFRRLSPTYTPRGSDVVRRRRVAEIALSGALLAIPALAGDAFGQDAGLPDSGITQGPTNVRGTVPLGRIQTALARSVDSGYYLETSRGHTYTNVGGVFRTSVVLPFRGAEIAITVTLNDNDNSERPANRVEIGVGERAILVQSLDGFAEAYQDQSGRSELTAVQIGLEPNFDQGFLGIYVVAVPRPEADPEHGAPIASYGYNSRNGAVFHSNILRSVEQ